MDQTTPLPASVRIASEVVEQIKAAGIDPETDEDFSALLDAECDLQEQLRRMMRAARWAAVQAEGCKVIIDETRDRQKRFEAKADRLKQIVLWAMQEAGLPRLQAPDFSASIAKGKAPLVITCDLSALPDQFVRITREPSKSALREALESGTVIEGVSFGQAAPYLSPKWR